MRRTAFGALGFRGIMALFEMSHEAISGLKRVQFADLGLLERGDLQRLLRDCVDVISSDTLVISEEFSSWDRSGRSIDLLGVDRQGRLVVIELKRTDDDKLADLQALRYAAMVSRMTFEEAVETYRAYLARREREGDPRAVLLNFLGWRDEMDGRFGEDVRIILAAADFSPEVTSTVLWLNERDLDITCVRVQPYRLRESTLLDVQQIIPLPEAADYQVQIRQKQRETRAVAGQVADWTRYDVTTAQGTQRALYKREVMLAAIRQLVARGEPLPEIETSAGRRILEVIEGSVDSAVVEAELARRRPNDLRAAKRFFTRNDQLFHATGGTYVLTTQWSKSSMEAVLAALNAKYGDFGFSYRVSESATET
jgi:hypothetical protein